MKLPRALKWIVLAGCSGPMPTPDGGVKDAGTPDAGDGACTLATQDQSCDAGQGALGPGYCTMVTLDDGGMGPYCEAPV